MTNLTHVFTLPAFASLRGKNSTLAEIPLQFIEAVTAYMAFILVLVPRRSLPARLAGPD